MHPFTCAWAVRAAPTATLSRAGRDAGATPRPEMQREKEGEVDSPGKAIAGATCPMPTEHATLEPKGSNTINHIGTKAREAPPWWHADLCEDEEC